MKLNYKGREIEVEFDVNGREMEDIYIASGFYVDTNESLTDEELEQVELENSDALYEAWYDMQVGASDFYMDMMEDR
jgi:hypothetical protein